MHGFEQMLIDAVSWFWAIWFVVFLLFCIKIWTLRWVWFCEHMRALCYCRTKIISVLPDDLVLTFTLTTNCSELIFLAISNLWQLLPTLAICLINVEYLFRLTYALNLGLRQDWFFWWGFFFFLNHRDNTNERVSSFKFPSSWCWSLLALWFCREGWREAEISCSGTWDTLKSFRCLSDGSNENFKEERWIPFLKVLKAVSALLTHISGLKRPL